jgi:hypothetical protein
MARRNKPRHDVYGRMPSLVGSRAGVAKTAHVYGYT